jgi:hypothetical protein
MTRFRAASIHFFTCIGIAAILLALFWFIWYPNPLFRAVGGLDVFLMLVGIDVILGPLLTYIVFNIGKKSLKFDLAVIAFVQLAALTYGVYALLVARPVYVASLGHRFDVIHANDVSDDSLAAANASLPWFGPHWVGIKPPTDKKEREKVLFSSVGGGGDYGSLPQYHAPIETMRAEMLQRALPAAELKRLNVGSEVDIDRWLAAHGRSETNTVFQGLAARSRDMAVVLDAKTGDVIGIAPFKPWQ